MKASCPSGLNQHIHHDFPDSRNLRELAAILQASTQSLPRDSLQTLKSEPVEKGYQQHTHSIRQEEVLTATTIFLLVLPPKLPQESICLTTSMPFDTKPNT